ncbi:transcriptional regulator [Azospirillum argentinense]|uniref:Transcriptional regulator n=1 Tax=Azospirillum argentinense TaxID=2970906 RepID=A0A2K1FXP2_9PROT|nr:transcriptional regulator [Azospirillum argentinense]
MAILSIEQCRAGRALLSWTQDELAKEARTAGRTVKDFERGARQPLDRTLRDLKEAMERAGVQFIAAGPYQGDGGPGVRLRADSDHSGL